MTFDLNIDGLPDEVKDFVIAVAEELNVSPSEAVCHVLVAEAKKRQKVLARRAKRKRDAAQPVSH